MVCEKKGKIFEKDVGRDIFQSKDGYMRNTDRRVKRKQKYEIYITEEKVIIISAKTTNGFNAEYGWIRKYAESWKLRLKTEISKLRFEN